MILSNNFSEVSTLSLIKEAECTTDPTWRLPLSLAISLSLQLLAPHSFTLYRGGLNLCPASKAVLAVNIQIMQVLYETGPNRVHSTN